MSLAANRVIDFIVRDKGRNNYWLFFFSCHQLFCSRYISFGAYLTGNKIHTIFYQLFSTLNVALTVCTGRIQFKVLTTLPLKFKGFLHED